MNLPSQTNAMTILARVIHRELNASNYARGLYLQIILSKRGDSTRILKTLVITRDYFNCEDCTRKQTRVRYLSFEKRDECTRE